MTLVDILIGFVGGVVVPAAVLYRYRHRIGRWIVERQARQTFEGGVDLAGAFDGAGMEGAGPDGTAVGEAGFDDAGMVADTVDRGGTVEEGSGDVGTAETGSDAAATTDDSGGGTRRCECGELVSPQLDVACPECGAPVTAE